jgi:ABC-type lipoprotein release transport system permease subunit
MDDGLVLNIAVILKDPERIAQGLAAIQAKLAGSDLSLQAVDWQQASGIVGQLILVLKFVLFLSIFIIFLVALVIINNAMVMATVERVTEIGTMRAIGAQRPWVIGLFLIETVVLGTVAGTLGALAAAMFVGYLGIVGIPAPMDAFVLLFAGPRLYPLCGADNFAFGVISVMVISVLSALYPAFLAARVQPVVAMAQKE